MSQQEKQECFDLLQEDRNCWAYCWLALKTHKRFHSLQFQETGELNFSS